MPRVAAVSVLIVVWSVLGCGGRPGPPSTPPPPRVPAPPPAPAAEGVLGPEAFRAVVAVRAADERTGFSADPDGSGTLLFHVRDGKDYGASWRWDPADGTFRHEPSLDRDCAPPSTYDAISTCVEAWNPQTEAWTRLPPMRTCWDCDSPTAVFHLLVDEIEFTTGDGGHGAVGTLRMWDLQRWTSVMVAEHAHEDAQWSEPAGILAYRVYGQASREEVSELWLWRRASGQRTRVGEGIGEFRLARDGESVVFWRDGEILRYDTGTDTSRVIGRGAGIRLHYAEDAGFVAWGTRGPDGVAGVRLGPDGDVVESFSPRGSSPNELACLWPDGHSVAWPEEGGRGQWKVLDLRTGATSVLSGIRAQYAPGACWPAPARGGDLTVLFPPEAAPVAPREPSYRVERAGGLELRREPRSTADVAPTLPVAGEVRFLGRMSQEGPVSWWEVEAGAEVGWVDGRGLVPR